MIIDLSGHNPFGVEDTAFSYNPPVLMMAVDGISCWSFWSDIVFGADHSTTTHGTVSVFCILTVSDRGGDGAVVLDSL